jgi:hypothetical protein
MSDSPKHHRDLERLLRSVRFEPRASLGAEVVGRVQRGERVAEARADTFRRGFGIVGIVLLLTLGLRVLWLLVFRPLHPFTVDRCCQDLDGGGEPDDGLMVVAEEGRNVQRLEIYEDLDGSRSYTPGDRIRFARNGTLSLSGPIGDSARTVEFCCLDYDGGGRSDDALVVVGRPPDRISMAGIYERFAPPGTPAQLR